MTSSGQETASPAKSPLVSGRTTPLKHTHSPYGLPTALSDAEKGVHAGFDTPSGPLSPAGSSGSLVSRPSLGPGDRQGDEEPHHRGPRHGGARHSAQLRVGNQGNQPTPGDYGNVAQLPPPQYQSDYHHPPPPGPGHPPAFPMQYSNPPVYGMANVPYAAPPGGVHQREYDTATSTPILSRSGSGCGFSTQDPSGLKHSPPHPPNTGPPPSFPVGMYPSAWNQGMVQMPPGLRQVQPDYSGVGVASQRSPQQRTALPPPPPPSLPPFPSAASGAPAPLPQAKTLSECAGAPIKQGGTPSFATGNVRFVPLAVPSQGPPMPSHPGPAPPFLGPQPFPLQALPNAPTPVLQSPPLQAKMQPQVRSPNQTPTNEHGESTKDPAKRECRHFLSGKCTWGENCRFRHSASPAVMPSAPPNSAASTPSLNGVLLSPPLSATPGNFPLASSVPLLSTLPPMSGVQVNLGQRAQQFDRAQNPAVAVITSPLNATAGGNAAPLTHEVQVHYRQRSRPTSFSSSRPATPFSYPLTPNESFSNPMVAAAAGTSASSAMRPSTPQLPEQPLSNVELPSSAPAVAVVNGVATKELRSGRSTPNARYAHNPYTSPGSAITPVKSDFAAAPAEASTVVLVVEALSGSSV